MELNGKQIGAVAVELGVNPKTIRYYEGIGLIPAPRRSSGGYRVYNQSDIDRISFILRARSLDFSLENISDILTLRQSGKAPCSYVLNLIEKEISAIDKKILSFNRLRNELTDIRNQAASFPELENIDRGCTCHLIENIVFGDS